MSQGGSLVHRHIIKHFWNAVRLHNIPIVTFCGNDVSPSAFLFHWWICLNAVDLPKFSWYYQYFEVDTIFQFLPLILCVMNWGHNGFTQQVFLLGSTTISACTQMSYHGSQQGCSEKLNSSCCLFLAILSVGYHFQLPFLLVF